MRSFWQKASPFIIVVLTSLLLAALAGCGTTEGVPQSVLRAVSPPAADTAGLFYFVFWIAVVIFILVEGLLVYFVIRYQRRAPDEQPEQYHGNTRLEITWTLIPALLLVVVFALTIRTMGQTGPTAAPAEGTALRVIGRQWWWEFQYDQGKVSTASELRMPTGQVMNLTVTSDNVIHSFWVPALMGKTDTVPTRENKTWLFSNTLGTYVGQCAEFCGAQHANMRFRVIVQTPAEFQTWLDGQRQPPVEPAAGSLEAQGKQMFLDATNRCIGCHAINGTNAKGITGPNLTHFASRGCFAGCTFENNRANLVRWLQNPQQMKPGNLMVINQLTPDQINALTAYLESLR